MKLLFCSAAGLLVLLAFGSGCASQPKSHETPTVTTADYSTQIEKGKGKMGRGDYDAAIAAFDQAIAMNPADPVGFMFRARARQANGDLDGALSDYARMPDWNPRFALAHVSRGSARMAKGDQPGAMSDFDQAVALAPDNAEVYAALAEVKRNHGELDEAIGYADLALALDPRLEPAYMNRALAKRYLRDYAGALADYDRILALYPTDTAAWTNRAAIKRDQADFDGAMADYTQAIAVYPDNSFAYNGIALLKASRGDFVGARETFLKAIAVEPWRATYNRFILTLILRRQHLDESPAGLAEAMRTWRDGWTKTVGGFVLGRITEAQLLAKADFGRPRKVREHRCEAYYYAGMIRLLGSDAVTARAYFGKCLETGITEFGEYGLAAFELHRLASRETARR